MMVGTLTCWDGRTLTLPDVIEWRFQYGTGTPCDSFQITCLWELAVDDDLAEATRFQAVQDGEIVFTGVVDECERSWGQEGGTLTVTGRGMAARLLDNETLGMEYQVATWQDILRDHVEPYGISAGESGSLPGVPGFQVATGSSEWQVVYDFCRYHGGITPRFDRWGRLVTAPWKDEKRLVLGPETAVSAFTLRDQRYGVLSQVLLRDRTSENVLSVKNEAFEARGGMSRKVITMPGKSTYQAMRYSGEYQLARSAEELRMVELELPGVFLAWPGDLVELQLGRGPGYGLWRVRESLCGLDSEGTYTRLTLGTPENG